ncbi:MTERF2 [Symbiodinium sp. CCMP2592]|nr:MTERF2 [Symbiodinium sp. CCMP2592]
MSRRKGSWKCCGKMLLLSFLAWGIAACTGPWWWKKGRPRAVHRSTAEVELLSHLAVLVMPEKPIQELFRDFPVEPSETWGSRWLCPDLSTYGVLRKEGAALFVEYDGHYRHCDEQGCKADARKTEALLRYAPEGSRVLRLGHSAREFGGLDGRLEVLVDVWRAGHKPSLLKAVVQTVQAVLRELKDEMLPEVYERLRLFEADEGSHAFHKSHEFVCKAVLTTDKEAKRANMQTFLQAELPSVDTELLARKFPAIWGCSIKTRMKPTLAWLEDVGLNHGRVAKVIAMFPSVLGLSIDGNMKPTVAWLEDVGLSQPQANLKPTVAWFEDVGLSQPQVAKVIAAKPQVLGLSIEANLKPTVAWFEDVGLSQPQVAKVIAAKPQVLGLSIEANLKPTVAWFEDVGLSQPQVAKVIAAKPQVLGLSIEANLKPTVAWFEDVGLSQPQVAKVIAVMPSVLGLSIEANLKPTVAWLEVVGLSQPQVAKVIAAMPQVLGLSIEANLKPTVAWLEDVGLSQPQVAKVVAASPAVLGLSIEANLKPTVAWLEDVGLSQPKVAKVIAAMPQVLGCSIEANLKPTVAWLQDVGLSQPQVARVIAAFPMLLGYSVRGNLWPKLRFLQDSFSSSEVCAMIVYHPPMLGYSFARLRHRLHVLQRNSCSRKLAKVMSLTDTHFERRSRNDWGKGKAIAPAMITTENAPVCPPEQRELPGPRSGFGAGLNRHEENHDQRFFSTTSEEFYGQGSRKKEKVDAAAVPHSAGLGTEHEEGRVRGMKVGVLCGEAYNDANNPASNTRTQRSWLYQHDPSLKNLHHGGRKNDLPGKDNELSIPIGQGAMAKVRADLKARQGRLYRVATLITKGNHHRPGVSIFQDDVLGVTC